MADTVRSQSYLTTAFAELPRKGITAQKCRDWIVTMFDPATMVVVTGGANNVPTMNDTYDLGSASYEWSALYVDDIIITGEVTGNLTPVATDTHDLGTDAARWKDGYFSGNVEITGVIKAGTRQTLSGSYATVLGGYDNVVSGTKSSCLGGNDNTVTGRSSGVTGGEFNEVSGDFSAIIGGTSNDISGDYSAVVGGYGSSATGDYCIAIGRNSLADKYAQHAHACRSFTNRGDAQTSVLVASESITHSDSSWHDLLLLQTQRINMLVNDTVWNFNINITGTTANVGKVFAFNISGIAKNDSGTVSIPASTVTTVYDTDDTDFDAQVAVDGADLDAFLIQVKDSTSGGDTVRWVARIELTEVSWPTA
ncbi:MAG: hypothetical protein GY841_02765 [FCB group bacterium]|nr:hypothetical protein [FCB group bacterium]